eukprot:gene38612-62151_t
MPVTMAAFSVGALGMIGMPPVAGFISKWYLGIGALQSDAAWVVAVLAGSSLLNAAYFLPLLYRAWLLPPPADRPAIRELATTRDRMLILPAALTALPAGLGHADRRGGLPSMTADLTLLLPLAVLWPMLLAGLALLPGWGPRMVRVEQVGLHIFYRFGGGRGAPG